MLGNSKGLDHEDWRVYSLIEIGEQTLRDVSCHDFLANYLHRALKHDGDVELEIAPHATKGQWLVGILIALGIGIAMVYFFEGARNAVVGGLIGTLILSFIGVLFTKQRAFSSLEALTIEGKRYTWRK